LRARFSGPCATRHGIREILSRFCAILRSLTGTFNILSLGLRGLPGIVACTPGYPDLILRRFRLTIGCFIFQKRECCGAKRYN
jgi:hypothetical protein